MGFQKNNHRIWPFPPEHTKKWLLLFAGILVVMALLLHFPARTKPAPVSHSALPLPQLQKQSHELTSDNSTIREIQFNVDSGDTWSQIAQAEGIPTSELHQILNQPLVFNDFPKLHQGEQLDFWFNQQHQLQKLSIPMGPHSDFAISVSGQKISSSLLEPAAVEKTITVHGVVQSSLYNSMRAAGVTPRLIMQFASIFSEDYNVPAEVRRGDHFNLIYGATYKNNKLVSTQLLAAELYLAKKPHYAILDDQDYYMADGASWQTAFMRAPLHYRYISSPFNLHRLQPILHIVRPHYGVDFAAPEGTPVDASSDGRIVYAGWMNGYGHVIILKESHIYSTRYAHLEKFAKGIYVGKYVKEGQLIGYVGDSGLATGPHLHYEFRIDDKPVNPMTAQLPPESPIARSALGSYESYVAAIKPLLG